MHFGMAQQVEVPDSIAHPLPRLWDGKRLRAVGMLAQSAVERHDAVAHQAFAHQAALSSEHRGRGVAGHACGQRQELMLLGQSDAAVTQVRDARAARLADARECQTNLD